MPGTARRLASTSPASTSDGVASMSTETLSRSSRTPERTSSAAIPSETSASIGVQSVK